ncbi:uncharacterized protein LOC121810840 [Salvia splendens]|uniref:uncharacterized protein LOC121810840 n=1 Tax=Salvia splendens TaxID=180675 RepID=UPI001C278076|nr:uncharacterized protein LOC121810840 [Salvia splendens]
MSSLTYPKLSLNVFIDKLKTKVLFAEANSDFINVLLSFITLPLGKIVTILQNHNGSDEAASIGSLTNLYKGLSDLDTAYFSTPGAKEMLLNPRSSFRAEWRKLAVDVTGAEPLQYYCCEDGNCSRNAFDNISVYSDIATCECGRSLNRGVRIEEGRGDDQAEAFICQLLKLWLTSETPLTDMIMKDTLDNPESDYWWLYNDDRHKIYNYAATESRKLVLRAFFHKSTNKFLFAEATDEFVELLFSFLAIP